MVCTHSLDDQCYGGYGCPRVVALTCLSSDAPKRRVLVSGECRMPTASGMLATMQLKDRSPTNRAQVHLWQQDSGRNLWPTGTGATDMRL